MGGEIRYCTTDDGVRIAYSVEGEGPPLVRALGWFTHLEFETKSPVWRPFMQGLSRGHQFVRYDGRGSGLSDREPGERSLDTYVADLSAVIEALRLPQFSLIGISQGGAAAVKYAVAQPDRVSRLILYGSFAYRPDFLESKEGREVFHSLLTLVRLGWGQKHPAFRQIFTSRFIPSATVEHIRWFDEMQRQSTSGENAEQVIRTNLELDVRELLPKVKTPTLVIHRRGDAVAPFALGRELAKNIPNARFVPLEGDNHLFLEGEPELEVMLSHVEEFTGAERTEARPSDGRNHISRLAAVLFTDLVGHSEMMSRLGDERGRAVLREHERITREVLKAHGGTEVKTMGDGFMASFGSVTRAVECAVALQQAFADLEGEPLSVRVGLNAGEPIEEDGDLFGATVILASRIAAKAEGGEILVADTVRGLCSGKGFLFADRGKFVAKGFEEPVRVYEVRWRDES
jgi:class 3 adenylate cyclase/predicted alpha/beta hydrolase